MTSQGTQEPQFDEYGGYLRNRPSGRGFPGLKPEFAMPLKDRAIVAAMGVEAFAVFAQSRSNAPEDRAWTSDRKAEDYAILASCLTKCVGSELGSLFHRIGWPPIVWSLADHSAPGGQYYLAERWHSKGIPTLIADLDIVPPQEEAERRTGVMVGRGPAGDLGKIYNTFDGLFRPKVSEYCFGEETPDGKCHFFFWFSLFRNEVARALNEPEGSVLVARILAQLKAQGMRLRSPNDMFERRPH